jgi:hypothetical protein
MEGLHDFTTGTGDTFKIALYTSSATLGATTTAYSSVNEVVGTGYVAGGATLTNVTPVTSGTTAYIDFGDAAWPGSTITARGALIYNDTAAGNPACLVLDFGADKSSSASTFTVVFPTADATSAIARIL